jgi:hypothetical protein
VPHIREYRVRSNVFAGSGFDRPQLLGTSTGRAESLDLGMVRFKLYSIEVDEVTNVIALARIRPRALQFDPFYYQYGGAYLYPLGAWYLLLSKFGVITVGPLDQMLRLSGRICLLRFKVGLPTSPFWKDDYNMVRPHSGLGNLAAPIFARNGATGTQQGCAMLGARPALFASASQQGSNQKGDSAHRWMKVESQARPIMPTLPRHPRTTFAFFPVLDLVDCLSAHCDCRSTGCRCLASRGLYTPPSRPCYVSPATCNYANDISIYTVL